MLLPFLFSFLLNHVIATLGVVEWNAAMVAAGVFAFVALRLRMDARERERRLAAALMIW